MSQLCEGKVVVVTGAGRGIGREFARALARAGARVVVNDLGTSISGEGSDVTPAREVVDEIKALGGEAVDNGDSVSEWQSAMKIVQCALDHFGRIDGVINNAGILRDRAFHKMSPDEWNAVINVHLNGSFYVARSAAPYFREQKSGSYIHMTSTSGLYGNFGQANYAAAKTGIAGLSKIIAIEMGPLGIRSNCISPSAFSRMVGSIPTDTEQQKQRVERIRKRTAPSTIAPVAVFLQSDASREVNGQIFYVRGNEIMLFNQYEVVRSVHRGEGWTPESIIEHAYPALKASMKPPRQAHEVTTWEPF